MAAGVYITPVTDRGFGFMLEPYVSPHPHSPLPAPLSSLASLSAL